MFAATAARVSADDPLAGLVLGEHPDPEPANDGWTTVTVKAASLNHHDVWTLRGVGISEDRLPIVLGCDAAGIDDEGNEVVVHAVISSPGWQGDQTLDPADRCSPSVTTARLPRSSPCRGATLSPSPPR